VESNAERAGLGGLVEEAAKGSSNLDSRNGSSENEVEKAGKVTKAMISLEEKRLLAEVMRNGKEQAILYLSPACTSGGDLIEVNWVGLPGACPGLLSKVHVQLYSGLSGAYKHMGVHLVENSSAKLIATYDPQIGNGPEKGTPLDRFKFAA